LPGFLAVCGETAGFSSLLRKNEGAAISLLPGSSLSRRCRTGVGQSNAPAASGTLPGVARGPAAHCRSHPIQDLASGTKHTLIPLFSKLTSVRLRRGNSRRCSEAAQITRVRYQLGGETRTLGVLLPCRLDSPFAGNGGRGEAHIPGNLERSQATIRELLRSAVTSFCSQNP
jgi:hypothetical protein